MKFSAFVLFFVLLLFSAFALRLAWAYLKPRLSRRRFLRSLTREMRRRPGMMLAANVAEGTHEGHQHLRADVAFTTRYLLGKAGSDASHFDICGAANMPIGLCEDEPAAGDLAALALLGTIKRTVKMVGQGTETKGINLYTAASGKVQAEPTGAGTYWLVGVSITAADSSNGVLEVQTCMPIKVIVIAAPTIGAAVVTTAATNSSPYGYTQAQADAIVARLNQALVDIAALQAAAAHPALIMHA